MPIDKRPPSDVELIVDAHCHLGHFRNFHIPNDDADGMVAVMDALGIDVALVASHAGISSDYVLGNNITLAATRAHPGRMLAYCVVNPNFPEQARDELDRCFADPVFRGIKVHPELHGDHPLDGRGYRPMWEYAAEHRLPVLSHTYFGGDRIEVFVGIAKEFPEVPILVGHCGVDLGLVHVVDSVLPYENLILDLTGPQAYQGVVEKLVAEVGAHRIVYGSDMPFNNAALQLGGTLYAQIPEADKRCILGGNAARLFRLDGREWAPGALEAAA